MILKRNDLKKEIFRDEIKEKKMIQRRSE